MGYLFKVCIRLARSDFRNEQACALILLPDRKRTSIRTLLWDLKLAVSAIGLRRVRKVMNREARIKAFHPTLPYSCLWFIGVHRDHQGKGIGSSLLKEGIEECNRTAKADLS